MSKPHLLFELHRKSATLPHRDGGTQREQALRRGRLIKTTASAWSWSILGGLHDPNGLVMVKPLSCEQVSRQTGASRPAVRVGGRGASEEALS